MQTRSKRTIATPCVVRKRTARQTSAARFPLTATTAIGLFDRIPDDTIVFSILPILSFSASVALERCSKRLRGLLLRDKRERCDKWLVRDVLGIDDVVKCKRILEQLATMAEGAGAQVYKFSTSEVAASNLVESKSSLQEAVVCFAEHELSAEDMETLDHLELTPFEGGYWHGEVQGKGENRCVQFCLTHTHTHTLTPSGRSRINNSCPCCASPTGRAPPHMVARCERHARGMYERNAVYRFVVIRMLGLGYPFDRLRVVPGALALLCRVCVCTCAFVWMCMCAYVWFVMLVPKRETINHLEAGHQSLSTRGRPTTAKWRWRIATSLQCLALLLWNICLASTVEEDTRLSFLADSR